MGSRASRIQVMLLCAGLFLLVAMPWEIAVRTGTVSSLALPAPSAVLRRLVTFPSDRLFLRNCLYTLTVCLGSLATGLTVGLVLGFSAGATRSVGAGLLAFFGFVRAIPPIALFPIALIAIGPGNAPVAVVVALGTALFVFPGTAEAARQTTYRFRNLSHVLGCTRGEFLRAFVVPGALLHAIASARVAASYAIAVTVAGEMIIGGRRGIGAAILDNSERYALEEAYAYVLVTGLLGLGLELLLQRISRLAPLD